MIPEPLGPDADAIMDVLVEMHCGECAGLGVPVSAVPLGGGLWLVTWLTEHRAGCGGRVYPESAFVMSADALADGDFDLPGVDGPDGQP